MERRVYLARHGALNILQDKKTYIGQLDIKLNEKGINQAERLALIFKDMLFTKIYCSDLLRTKTTAKIIAEGHNMKPIIVKNLNEIHLGDWEGLCFEEVKKNYPQEFDKRGKDIINYCIPGGESFLECSSRVMKAFNEIISSTQGNFLIVAHAGVNRMILCNILNIPLEQLFTIPQEYGCYNIILQREGKLSVEEINKTCSSTKTNLCSNSF
jgi:probable phosphoglycerate mutase